MTNVRLSASPPLAANGSIYAVGVTSGLLYRLNSSGGVTWSLDLQPNELCFSSPAIGPDGTIYVGAGRKLFAVSDTNTLMSSFWPIFRGNLRHTARTIQRGMKSPAYSLDGGFTMTLNVETGRTYQVDYSTNFTNWAGVSSFSSDTPTCQFNDPSATNSPGRFYCLQTRLP